MPHNLIIRDHKAIIAHNKEVILKVEKKDRTVSLKYEFTEQDQLELGKELAKQSDALERVEEKKKRINDQIKAEMSECEAQIKRLTGDLTTGFKYVDIECEDVFDFDLASVATYRKDTGEEVESRRMKDYERQPSLI